MKREAKKREEKTKESMKERRNSPMLALLFTDWDFHWLKMGLVSLSRNLPSETDRGATWPQALTQAQRVSQKKQIHTENWKGGTCTEEEAGRHQTRSHWQSWGNGYTGKVLAAHDWEPAFRSLAPTHKSGRVACVCKPATPGRGMGVGAGVKHSLECNLAS